MCFFKQITLFSFYLQKEVLWASYSYDMPHSPKDNLCGNKKMRVQTNLVITNKTVNQNQYTTANYHSVTLLSFWLTL